MSIRSNPFAKHWGLRPSSIVNPFAIRKRTSCPAELGSSSQTKSFARGHAYPLLPWSASPGSMRDMHVPGRQCGCATLHPQPLETRPCAPPSPQDLLRIERPLASPPRVHDWQSFRTPETAPHGSGEGPLLLLACVCVDRVHLHSFSVKRTDKNLATGFHRPALSYGLDQSWFAQRSGSLPVQ